MCLLLLIRKSVSDSPKAEGCWTKVRYFLDPTLGLGLYSRHCLYHRGVELLLSAPLCAGFGEAAPHRVLLFTASVE